VALELRARGLVGAEVAERNPWLTGAREMMERAARALEDAGRLAADDARFGAEAGSVVVRYLQRDPERARSLLENAVALGETEVAELAARARPPATDALDERSRAARRQDLENAQTRVGDICLDLGMLHLTLLGEPQKARTWLEKSREAGPDPRPEIEGLLERCRATLAREIDPRLRDENRWAAPIPASPTRKRP
jgi:hypothetical protein